MSKVILDASVALSWLLPGEETEKMLELKNRAVENPGLQLIVPPIFWYEIANTLWVAVKKSRIALNMAPIAIKALMDFDISVRPTDPAEDLSISIEENIAVYDSSYLSLAKNQNATLWTLDKVMIRVAKKLKIQL